MDQLKLALEHKFWILTAVAVLLPPIGWWMASGNLAAETSKRTSAVQGSLTTITNAAKDPAKAPNANWTESALEIDDKLGSQLGQTQVMLFDREQPLQTWPEMVEKALKKAGWRKATDPKAMMEAKQFFVARYDDDWLKVLDNLEPFVPETSTGKVLLDYKKVTRAPVSGWTDMLFSEDEMFNAQEDLWLLKALVLAIAKVNQGATDIGEAPIKKVAEMMLRGGLAADLEMRRVGKPARANFDPDDVFGADGSSPTAGGGGGGIGFGKKDENVKQHVMRYVTSQGNKWQSRGFVLRLVMDEGQIPRLISVLSESKFPVAIKHLEFKVYDFHPGGEAAQLKWTGMQGQIADPARHLEREKLRAKLSTALDVAFNQNDLADVIVAGTFTIFNSPPKSSTASAAGSPPGNSTRQPIAPQASKTGTPVKPSAPGTRSGPAGPASAAAAPGATKGTTPSKPAPAPASGKAVPNANAVPAKPSGAPAKPAEATKSPAAPAGSRAPGAQGTKAASPAGK